MARRSPSRECPAGHLVRRRLPGEADGADRTKCWTVALIIGLLLTPVAAFLGTVQIIVLTPLVFGGQFPDPVELLRIGTVAGSLYAAPTTIVVLPLADHLLARGNHPAAGRLSAIGFLAGAATMMIVVWLTRKPEEAILALAPIAITFVGAVSGGLSGLLFGLIMSRWRRT